MAQVVERNGDRHPTFSHSKLNAISLRRMRTCLSAIKERGQALAQRGACPLWGSMAADARQLPATCLSPTAARAARCLSPRRPRRRARVVGVNDSSIRRGQYWPLISFSEQRNRSGCDGDRARLECRLPPPLQGLRTPSAVQRKCRSALSWRPMAEALVISDGTRRHVRVGAMMMPSKVARSQRGEAAGATRLSTARACRA